MRLGKAEVGDKTMVDVLVPFAETPATRPPTRATTWPTPGTPPPARRGTPPTATTDLLPRKGRARPHAEKSLGTPDVRRSTLTAPCERAGAAHPRP